ncbi:MAG: DPP IV N-terminal domain-containing protein, partial [Planctomycetota bacterium]
MNEKLLAVAAYLFLATTVIYAGPSEAMRLAADPALSPDGKTLAFVWRGDIWLAPVEGGAARQLTQHETPDRQPVFSPDGSRIAFVSDREAGSQVYIVPVEGGTPEQVTFHTAGFSLEDWYPA